MAGIAHVDRPGPAQAVGSLTDLRPTQGPCHDAQRSAVPGARLLGPSDERRKVLRCMVLLCGNHLELVRHADLVKRAPARSSWLPRVHRCSADADDAADAVSSTPVPTFGHGRHEATRARPGPPGWTGAPRAGSPFRDGMSAQVGKTLRAPPMRVSPLASPVPARDAGGPPAVRERPHPRRRGSRSRLFDAQWCGSGTGGGALPQRRVPALFPALWAARVRACTPR